MASDHPSACGEDRSLQFDGGYERRGPRRVLAPQEHKLRDAVDEFITELLR